MTVFLLGALYTKNILNTTEQWKNYYNINYIYSICDKNVVGQCLNWLLIYLINSPIHLYIKRLILLRIRQSFAQQTRH